MNNITKQQIANFRARINKANKSFSIGTDMFLSFDIDGMSLENLMALQSGLLNSRAPLSYDYLDKKVAKLTNKQE